MSMQNSFDAMSQKVQLQNAVYAGLISVFNEEEATLALNSWELHTNGSDSLFNGVNSFAREICNSLNKPEKHRDLVKALNRALILRKPISNVNKSSNQNVAETPPSSLITHSFASKTPSVTDHNIGTSAFLSFQLVLLTLIKHLTLQGDATKNNAVIFLNEITENMPWSEIQQEQILALINEGSIQPARTYKLDQLKNFLKYFKSWMRDEIGIIVTNDLINQVIDEVAVMNEAQKFSPKDLF